MHNTNQTNQSKPKLLNSWPYVAGIVDEFSDCTYTTAIVYSYMLCKHSWFKTKGQGYFESQEQIAESARIPLRSTKTAIKWLSQKGLLKIKKQGSGMHSHNVYDVVDKYSVHKPTQLKKVEPPRPLWIEENEDVEPF